MAKSLSVSDTRKPRVAGSTIRNAGLLRKTVTLGIDDLMIQDRWPLVDEIAAYLEIKRDTV